jgi:hypothetical protein
MTRSSVYLGKVVARMSDPVLPSSSTPGASSVRLFAYTVYTSINGKNHHICIQKKTTGGFAANGETNNLV